MRKTIPLLLLFLSLLIALTACGSTSEETTSQSSITQNNQNSQVTDEKWPNDTITLIVPYDVGGTSDRIARGVAKKLTNELGVPVTVENRVGGSGIVGTKAYLNNDPSDGSYLLFVSHPHFEGSIIRDGTFSYDDFDMIGVVHSSPIGLWVNSNAGFDTAEDFINELRNNPGKYAYGGLAGSYSVVTAEMFNELFGIEARGVPFDGGGELRVSVISGITDYIMTDMEGTLSAAGEDLKPLLVFDYERFDLTPDVPTIGEVIESMGLDATFPAQANMKSILANKKIKEQYPERFEILMTAIGNVMQDEELLKEFEAQGLYLGWYPGDEGLSLALDGYESIKQFEDLFK